MRIFLIWADHGSELKIVMDEIENAGHSIAYWVGSPLRVADTSRGTIFHSYVDAADGKPPTDIDINEFPPIGKSIIEKFYKIESLMLTMMNRMFDRLCVDERRHIYYQMLRYWFGVFQKFKPDIVVFPVIPHSGSDFLIYEITRAQGIKIIAFHDTRFPARLLSFPDFWQGNERLRMELREQSESVSVDDLAPDIRNYYIERSNPAYRAVPGYVKDQKKKHSLFWKIYLDSRIRASIKDFSIAWKAPRYCWSRFRTDGWMLVKQAFTRLSYFARPNLKREYRRVERVSDFSKKFIYVPLQKQSERTTSPQGDMFADQILALQILSSALPDGWMIYTKEHPMQWIHFGIGFTSNRYQGYYERIAGIPNVHLVPLDVSSYDLINGAEAVAAVTGSACWEAVLRLKPALIFGYAWYEDCPGIFKVEDVDTCRKAFARIRGGFTVDQADTLRYLKCFERVTIPGYIALSAGKGSNISRPESMRAIARAIIQELEKK